MKKALPLLLAALLMLLCAGCSNSADRDAYYGIDHFHIHEEGDAFRAAFDELTTDVFRWYQGLEGEDGVYLMHYDFFSADLLAEWRAAGIYQNVPEAPLHYYVASENYLADRGMALSEEEHDLIAAGVRLYLLPSTLSAEERDAAAAFLTEDALLGLNDEHLIDTAFSADRQITFRTYEPTATLEIPGGDEITDPVIFVASTENMSFFEAESLIATGVADGYIRLSRDAYRRYAGDALPAELREMDVTFLELGRMSN